jgi:hypothetical protein
MSETEGRRPEGMAVTPADLIRVPKQKVDAALALEVVQALIADPQGREDYKQDPVAAFSRQRDLFDESSVLRKTWYEAIPPDSRTAMESLSVDELAALSRLDQTFVADGLYVEVPSPGKLFFK